MPGPVPKRSDQRIRRNLDVVDITSIVMPDEVPVPELGIEDPHPVIAEFYEHLKSSGQAKYYEPSDWSFAKFNLHFADRLIKSKQPSSQMLASINSALNDLLVSEGQRRRVRMEVERTRSGDVPDTSDTKNISDLFRERLAQ